MAFNVNPIEWVGAIIKPISDAYKANQDRKIARDSAKAKIVLAKNEGDQEITLKDAEAEALAVQEQRHTWKDEYATVSIISILNLYVVGGLAAAFGYPEVLQGTAIATNALVNAGVDLGWLLEVVVLAAVGLKVWRR